MENITIDQSIALAAIFILGFFAIGLIFFCMLKDGESYMLKKNAMLLRHRKEREDLEKFRSATMHSIYFKDKASQHFNKQENIFFSGGSHD